MSSLTKMNVLEKGKKEITDIPHLSYSIMSPDKNTQIAALKGILDIVINDLHSFESLFVNNVIDDLNRIIANGEGEEVFALSTTILHVLGVRCQVMDAAVCAREATESLIQIIHSENKQQSKAGSKALCDLVEANYVIQNSLLTTGFAQVVLRTLILGTQEQGKDSSSSQQSSSDKLIPTFIKAGLLNVILKLTEQSQELESLAVLIPVLEDLKQNGENRLKTKAISILSALKENNITALPSIDNVKEKNDYIKKLEKEIKHKNEEIIHEKEEKEREKQEKEREKVEKEKLSIELHFEKEQKDKLSLELLIKQKENEILQLENEKLVDQIKLLKIKSNPNDQNSKLKMQDEKTEYEMEISQLREQGIYPIEIINKDPQHIEITALDLVQRRINIKKANPCTITLSQILESGIWSIEVLFQKTQGRSGIGVVRDLYNIPAGAIPTEEPHNKFIALFGGKRQEFSLYYRQVVIQGNAKFTDGQILRLEYDSESGRLFYFIDDVQQPVSFAGINKNQKLRFIIYMYYEESSCLIRSLKKIAVRTSNDNDADGKLVLWREL